MHMYLIKKNSSIFTVPKKDVFITHVIRSLKLFFKKGWKPQNYFIYRYYSKYQVNFPWKSDPSMIYFDVTRIYNSNLK